MSNCELLPGGAGASDGARSAGFVLRRCRLSADADARSVSPSGEMALASAESPSLLGNAPAVDVDAQDLTAFDIGSYVIDVCCIL